MKSSKVLLLTFLGLTVALFVYVILRAYTLGFTIDESKTFTILIGEKQWILTANNHWLNTILTYLSYKLFGPSELALRLPNILGFLFYSYYCYKLVVEKSTSIISTIAPILFLMLNPLVIDFFSLARGYGLAMAFFSGSLYYFLRFYEDPYSNKALVKGIVFSILTIYANYAFIVSIIALHIGYLVRIYSTMPAFRSIGKQLLFLTFEAIALLPAVFNLLILKNGNQLYYGGTHNIVKDTLFSLFNNTFPIKLVADQNAAILILISVAIIFGLIIKKQNSLKFLLIILFSVLLIPVLLHSTLDMKYPLDRTALYWVVIFGVYFHVLLENLIYIKRKNSVYLTGITIYCISFLVVYGFFCTANVSYCQLWKFDADTRSMLEVLNEETKSGEKIRLGVHVLFEPTINYYKIAKDYNFIELVTHTQEGVTDKEGDYYYSFKGDDIAIGCQEVIKNFNLSNTKLIKNCR